LYGLDHAIVYVVRLATGYTLGHKFVALNFFFGLGLAMIWTTLSLLIAQYLEVILLTEKLKGETQTFLRRLRFGFRTINLLVVIGCMLVLLFPVLSRL
jgi:hypothetical protein